MRKRVLALALVVFAAAAAGASAMTRASPPPPPAAVAKCNSGQIGFLGPLSGPFTSVGREQLNWATLALNTFNKANGTHFTLKKGDTQLNPKVALKVGAAFAASKTLLATIGPAGSQEIGALGKLFTQKGLPAITSSATSVTLSGGAYPTLSRVVASDAVQGTSDATFMAGKLHAKKVLIIDDAEPYSTTIAAAAAKALKASGVQVVRKSVSQTVTDFSSLVASIASETDVVFLPWQLPSNAQSFADLMQEQGVTAQLVGSDLLDSTQFTTAGAYVSSFARDIHGLPGTAPVIAAYNAAYGTKWGLFGPPTYVAAQVIATAYKAACADGTATRAELLQAIRAVRLQKSILGIPVSFDKHGEMTSARFYVSQIQSDGTHKLVW
jgi:branched-chain amino acid transport system substrate-binding protein